MNRLTRSAITRCVLLSMVYVAFSVVSMAHAAPPWEQVGKMIASDGKYGRDFGMAVSLSGNLAVIGDPRNVTGSAYVFDTTTGQQLFELFPADGVAGDWFGYSVATSGNFAVIGALNDANDNGDNFGSAYVFDVTTGQQLFKLLPSDGAANDFFGNSVAISGNIAVIGAVGDKDSGDHSGSAYVFDVTTGQQLFKLLPSDGAKKDNFGISVAVSGTMAMFGAQYDDDNGNDSGSAYVFDITTGQQLFKLLAADGVAGDNFGKSVAITGNFAVIGALYADNDNGIYSGSVYVFDVKTGQQLFKLLPSDGAAYNFFGNSVAVSGHLAVIGADGDNDNGTRSGSAYIFDITTGQQLFKLLPSDGAGYDWFGFSVALDGNLAVIGAPDDDYNGDFSGSAYVFQLRTTNYLTVEPFPLKSGGFGKFSFVDGLSDEDSWLLYSVNGLGNTFIHDLNITVNLKFPRIALGPGLTDGNGDREVTRRMPVVTEPMDVWFQVVQHENVTNFFRTQIVR